MFASTVFRRAFAWVILVIAIVAAACQFLWGALDMRPMSSTFTVALDVGTAAMLVLVVFGAAVIVFGPFTDGVRGDRLPSFLVVIALIIAIGSYIVSAPAPARTAVNVLAAVGAITVLYYALSFAQDSIERFNTRREATGDADHADESLGDQES